VKRIVIVLLAWLLMGQLSTHAQSAVALRITTERQQKTQREIVQRANMRAEGNVEYHKPEIAEQTQAVVMNVRLQNMTGNDLKGVQVKYIVFGKDKTGQSVKVAVQGEQAVDIRSLQTVSVETKPAEFRSRERTFRNGEFTSQNTREGEQYYGIAVAAYVGARQIAVSYEPPGVEKQMGKLGVRF
jgi:hypothetical protein